MKLIFMISSWLLVCVDMIPETECDESINVFLFTVLFLYSY